MFPSLCSFFKLVFTKKNITFCTFSVTISPFAGVYNSIFINLCSTPWYIIIFNIGALIICDSIEHEWKDTGFPRFRPTFCCTSTWKDLLKDLKVGVIVLESIIGIRFVQTWLAVVYRGRGMGAMFCIEPEKRQSTFLGPLEWRNLFWPSNKVSSYEKLT